MGRSPGRFAVAARTMNLRSPIFAALAEVYEESQAGRTGLGTRDVQPEFAELCVRAGLGEGDAFELAVAELKAADGRFVKLEWDHPRARTTIHKVRLSPRDEAEFYQRLGRESPTARRESWVALFEDARGWPVAARFAGEWREFCAARARRALHWDAMEPFRVRELRQGKFLLDLTARLLGWEGRNLIRWVSSHLCGDSKRLERRQRTLEFLLHESTAGRVPDFAAHGIEPMPREVRLHGPLRLLIDGCWLDCSVQETAMLSLADLARVASVECPAARCLTVENKTAFLDLARKRSGELLVWTSFPTAPTLALLALLPRTLEFWHFGDTDPQGFHILHDLRRRSGLPFRTLHMRWHPAADGTPLTETETKLLHDLIADDSMREERDAMAAMLSAGNKGAFEQEHLQPPPLAHWPFYPGP